MSIPDGPEGIILESVLEGLDEYYSADLSQKIKRGMYDNALEQKSTGGPTPYGYKLNEQKQFVIDEDKSSIVREIFTRYAAGEQIVSINNDLNSRGIRTARGGLFNKSSLHRMFTNEKYIGILRYKSNDERFDDVFIENGVPAIVDKDIFEKVAAKLKSNKRKTAKKDCIPVEFLLTGKLFDAVCGGSFVGDSGTSQTGKTHHYYNCNNHKGKNKCKTKPIPKELIEELVVDTTRECVLTEEVIQFVGEQIIALQEEEKDTTLLRTIKNELSITQKSLQNILKAIEQGIVTDTTKNRLLELEERQAQLESQYQFEECKLNAPKITKEHVIYWLEQFKNCNANKEEYKRQVIDTFVNSVVLDQ